MKFLGKYWHCFLSALIFTGLIWIVIHFKSQGIEGVTLIALGVTTLVYSFQLGVMKGQKNLSEESFKNQEKILDEQKNIAKKQYDFDIFKLRMDLRNSLQRNFILLLSANNYEIENDVNSVLVDTGKIVDSINFAFPKDKKLDKLISDFKSQCKKIANLAPEKEILIECSEKMFVNNGYVMKYKECMQVYSKNGNYECSITNKSLFESLNISTKKKDIILGIMSKYIDSGKTKDEIIDYLFKVFDIEMAEGKRILNQIFEILDKNIKLS